jgi:hypothetical protein
MSTTGLTAIALRQKGYAGLYASHPIPAGQYGDGGQYIIGTPTQDLGYGAVSAGLGAIQDSLNAVHMGALQLGAAVAGDENGGMGILGIAVLGGLALFAYKEITSGPKLKAARNNPRRRKNGTKKGMRRKTARRAYMKSAKQKRSQSKAAKAMKLYHSGKAPSLKAAGRMV